VLAAAREIRRGQTTTYFALGTALGAPRAARAVGNALARNPTLVVVPCHRVLRATGGLGGYAAGTERKAFLLALERPGG